MIWSRNSCKARTPLDWRKPSTQQDHSLAILQSRTTYNTLPGFRLHLAWWAFAFALEKKGGVAALSYLGHRGSAEG